jgi:hypothetical protein
VSAAQLSIPERKSDLIIIYRFSPLMNVPEKGLHDDERIMFVLIAAVREMHGWRQRSSAKKNRSLRVTPGHLCLRVWMTKKKIAFLKFFPQSLSCHSKA